MKFAVRYWSSRLPKAPGETGGQPQWVEYSVHPASKLGLHSALLAVYDRLEILQAHGGQYECAVFVTEDGHGEKLSREMADNLFRHLPRGEVKWPDIERFLLPAQPGAPVPGRAPETRPPGGQLALFDHIHTPYDDLEMPPHMLDIDI